MTLFIVLFLVGFGLVQLGKFAKNNPGTSIKAVTLLRDALR